MHGRAIEALDDLIRAWSRWDEHEQYYLEDLAPRIARSDDPDFRWLDREQQRHGRRSGPTERMIAVRLKELMSPEEWRILPELIRARRGLELHELESDAERRSRIAGREAAARDAEQARRDAERERRETEEWPDAFDRARQEGEARLAREEEEQAAAREAEERERLDRAAEVARRLEDARLAQREREERDRREAEERSRRDDEEHRARREAEKQAALDEANQADHEETDLEPRDAEAEPLPDGAREAAPRPVPPTSGHGDGEHGTRRVDRDGAASSAAQPPAQEDAMADDSHDEDELQARLRELAELADEGLISPEEYAEHRERVAGELPEAEEAMTDAVESNDTDDASDDADDGTDTADATDADEPDDFPAVDDDAEDDEASDDEPPTGEDAEVDALSPVGGALAGVARDLRGYARRLTGKGEEGLADAVREYAERVRGVERGELPAVLSVAPAAIAPEMVGAALVRRRLEGFLEFFRNVLIFMPVLWTWLKLYFAIEAYTLGSDENFFNFWVNTGGPVPYLGFLGGKLADAAVQVAVILALLVVVNSLLGMLRGRTERRREREARRFAAVLARAEAAGAAQRVEDPQSALAGFAVAATGLTTELRSVGEGLQRSAAPFIEASEAFADQRRQLNEVIEQLRGIAAMGDQLGALRTEFAEAREAAKRSADALTGIRQNLDLSAENLVGVAQNLEHLARPLERMTEDMSATHTELNSSLEAIAADLREAATSMNTVATRVLDEIGDGRGGRR
ncbi:MAG: hypothetical protein OXH97_03225 [Chloroflexota bacterium]|nr:hypothetical protein [Chloroflexota bacterium]